MFSNKLGAHGPEIDRPMNGEISIERRLGAKGPEIDKSVNGEISIERRLGAKGPEIQNNQELLDNKMPSFSRSQFLSNTPSAPHLVRELPPSTIELFGKIKGKVDPELMQQLQKMANDKQLQYDPTSNTISIQGGRMSKPMVIPLKDVDTLVIEAIPSVESAKGYIFKAYGPPGPDDTRSRISYSLGLIPFMSEKPTITTSTQPIPVKISDTAAIKVDPVKDNELYRVIEGLRDLLKDKSKDFFKVSVDPATGEAKLSMFLDMQDGPREFANSKLVPSPNEPAAVFEKRLKVELKKVIQEGIKAMLEEVAREREKLAGM